MIIKQATLAEIEDQFKKNKTFALICHINPDGDTVGSALAIYSILSKEGKTVHLFSQDSISDKLKYLPNTDKFNTCLEKQYDVAIAVDSSTRSRLGDKYSIFESAKVKIVIDHHLDSSIVCDYIYVNNKIASTAEIVFELLYNYKNGKLDKDTATALYAGILTDTVLFSTDTTTSKTHTIISKLYDFGIKASEIAYNVFTKKSHQAFLLTKTAINRLRFFADSKIGITYFLLEDFEKCQAIQSDTEGVVNIIKSIDTILVAITITQVEEKRFRLSIRSREPVSASEIAGVFGGAGHRLAAGCRITGNLEEIIENVVKAASDRLPC